MLLEKTADRARGQWPGILAAVGVPSKALTNRHGPCPMCGGKDRFRFDNKDGKGTWICSQCGAGDGIKLVMHFLNVDFREAAKRVDAHIGEAVAYTPQGLPKAQGIDLGKVWGRTSAITAADLVGQYLTARTGIVEYPAKLRFSPDERYVEEGARPTFFPAMLAKVDPCDEAVRAGETASIHRTFLSPMGGKAEVSAPRKMLGGMPTGAAVRLMDHGDTLGIAEGIETALSASAWFGIPCWAAVNEGALQGWSPPASVKTVWIFGDNDPKFAGQAAAFILAKKLALKGLEVFVEIAPNVGWDWNDVHRQRMEAAR